MHNFVSGAHRPQNFQRWQTCSSGTPTSLSETCVVARGGFGDPFSPTHTKIDFLRRSINQMPLINRLPESSLTFKKRRLYRFPL